MVRLEPTSLLLAPSTRNRLLVVALPFTEKSTPASRPLLLALKLSAAETPGCSCVSCTKLRPFSGSSRTCSPVTTSPRAALSVHLDLARRYRHHLRGTSDLELNVDGFHSGGV